MQIQRVTQGAAIVLLTILCACSQPDTGRSMASEEQGKTSSDLSALIATGEVSLVRANGNGASSGSSIEAVLLNNTGREIDVDVFMRQPVFLANSGAGQNMIASMVLGADGGYMQDGDQSVVTLPPGEHFAASIVAYCADMAKDNPTAAETFTVTQGPPHLNPVIARINDYVRANPNADVTSAAQVAIWLAQGESSDEIAKKFDFTRGDEELARQFLH